MTTKLDPVPDQIINRYARQASAIYDARLAGDCTWAGLLAEFARELLRAAQAEGFIAPDAEDLRSAALNAVAKHPGRPLDAIRDARNATDRSWSLSEYANAVRWAEAQAAGRVVTVALSTDHIEALRALLGLVHYDDLAQGWRDLLPAELLAAINEEG